MAATAVAAESSDVGGGAALKLWTFGCNDHMTELPEEKVRSFKPTGSFRQDFVALCTDCGVVPHTAFAAQMGTESAAATTLAAQSILLDRTTLQAMRHLLPTTEDMHILRLNSCKLNTEMFAILKEGFSEGCSVTTLQVDWNSLELPHEDVAELRRIAAEGTVEELDALESKRALKQAQRTLREFGERLQGQFGDVASALHGAKEAVASTESLAVALAAFVPLDVSAWTELWSLRVPTWPTSEIEVAFRLLDSPQIGQGDGLVPLARLETALSAFLPQAQNSSAPPTGGTVPPTPGGAQKGPPVAEEESDPIGVTFASLFDASSVIELLSLRHCNIGRAECHAMGKSLAIAPHLRALNLWGNKICDQGAALLARGLETNFGLQYLGLGRNLITHLGLQDLCKPLGVTVLGEKATADPVVKACREMTKERDKKLKTQPPNKKAANGKERYTPILYVPTCEDFKDAETNHQYWLWTRGLALKTLVLEHNPVADADAVQALQPFGCGTLVLKGTPCAEELLKRESSSAAEAKTAAEKSDAAGDTGTGDVPPPATVAAPTESKPPPFKGPAEKVTGWRFVLK